MKKEYKICKWTEPMSFISHFIYETTYTEIEKVNLLEFENELTLIKHNDSETYVIGELVEVIRDDSKSQLPVLKFEIYFEVELKKYELENFNYENLFSVNRIRGKLKEHIHNLSIFMHKFLIKKNYLIIGNNNTYFGNKEIWTNVLNTTNILVDIIDFEKNKIINENVILNKENTNNEKYILLVLKDII